MNSTVISDEYLAFTLLLNQTDSSCQIPQTGITCGRPSGHTVAIQ
jgi:hypothetical protein